MRKGYYIQIKLWFELCVIHIEKNSKMRILIFKAGETKNA